MSAVHASADDVRLVLLGQSLIQYDLRQSEPGRRVLSEMRLLLQQQSNANAIFTGLETALIPSDATTTADGPLQPQRSTVFFHAAPVAVLDCLQSMGVNLLATANNHVGDLGEVGIHALMQECKARQICQAGVGMNAAEAALSACLPRTARCRRRIAHVCFASKIPVSSVATDTPPRPGVNCLSMTDVERRILSRCDLTRIEKSIQLARHGDGNMETAADLVIAYHHNHYWEKDVAVNVEGALGSWRRDLAHRLIDAGASLYVAHGEPRLQGIEIYKGCPIFFGLGNFIFQTKTAVAFYGTEVWQSVVAELHYRDNGTLSVKLVPLVLNEVGETTATHLATRGLPKLASRSEGTAILQKLQRLSDPFGTVIRFEAAQDRTEDSDDKRDAGVCGWVVVPVRRGTASC
jgi:poly-gamma-glutamate capsule biosynthesis protein CapA/YwtB (metallophosphatase superfamily)